MNIGNYKIVRLLGKGGMSEVYEAENLRLGSRHALKLFTYEKDDPDVRERFLVEGKLLARLSHPRIVKVTDFGTDEASGKPYFVMDLVLNERGEMQLLSDVEPGTVDEEIRRGAVLLVPASKKYGGFLEELDLSSVIPQGDSQAP